MSDLYTVNKSPFERNSLETCLRMALPGASILLFEDAVYGAVKGTVVADRVTAAMADKKVYVLGADLKARGLGTDRLVEGVTLVDYAGFVDLVENNDKVQAWL